MVSRDEILLRVAGRLCTGRNRRFVARATIGRGDTGPLKRAGRYAAQPQRFARRRAEDARRRSGNSRSPALRSHQRRADPALQPDKGPVLRLAYFSPQAASKQPRADTRQLATRKGWPSAADSRQLATRAQIPAHRYPRVGRRQQATMDRPPWTGHPQGVALL